MRNNRFLIFAVFAVIAMISICAVEPHYQLINLPGDIRDQHRDAIAGAKIYCTRPEMKGNSGPNIQQTLLVISRWLM